MWVVNIECGYTSDNITCQMFYTLFEENALFHSWYLSVGFIEEKIVLFRFSILKSFNLHNLLDHFLKELTNQCQRINTKRRQEVLLYNDCFLRSVPYVRWRQESSFPDRSRWVALVDLDEVILPSQGQVRISCHFSKFRSILLLLWYCSCWPCNLVRTPRGLLRTLPVTRLWQPILAHSNWGQI